MFTILSVRKTVQPAAISEDITITRYDVAWKNVQTRKQATAYARKAAQSGYRNVAVRPTQDVIFDTYSDSLVRMGIAETVLSAPYGKVMDAVLVES